eukprot:m.67163 g.67163  ORF g.67163 m.67163 type:complete len:224 (-) comp8208_c0_seq1:1584-2255(-)
MSCRDEATESDHHHSHDGHDHHHDHDHDHDDPERGVEESLFEYIDTTKLFAYNEAVTESCKGVFRPGAEKANRDKFVESDADEQLIIHIPFTGNVKLKSICVMGEGGQCHPAHMKAFINREDIDFDNVEDMEALQEWDMVEDLSGEMEYETRITKFQGVYSLTLFFNENFGGETTKIFYIGLKGECKEVTRRMYITIAETAARPEDHKTKIKDMTKNSARNIQ